jgi:hypothetical protein
MRRRKISDKGVGSRMGEVKGGQLFVGESGRTSVKKLLPPQAMRGICLVRSYVTLAITVVSFPDCSVQITVQISNAYT